MNLVIIIVENLKVIFEIKLYCNYLFYFIGPHCKNESQLSIIWQKATAGQTVTKHCPGELKNGKEKNPLFVLNEINFRKCLSNMSTN